MRINDKNKERLEDWELGEGSILLVVIIKMETNIWVTLVFLLLFFLLFGDNPNDPHHHPHPPHI